MKILALLFVASCQAFAPWGTTRTTTRLYNARVDSTEAIQAAVAASKTYGAGSPEARVAWDIVEEMDASDNSASYTGGVTDEDCYVPEEDETDACKEYAEKMEQLTDLIQEFGPKMEKAKTLATEIQALKMPETDGLPGSDSPALREAMAEAKKISADKGADSDEAKVAWAEVEDIAAASNNPALGGALSDECLVDAIEACEALEELNRVVQQKPGRYVED